MAMHKTNGLLKFVLIPVIILVVVALLLSNFHSKKKHVENTTYKTITEEKIENAASNDSAAESLDTLTAELASTKQQVEQITKDNAALKNQNEALLKKAQGVQEATTASLAAEVEQLKNQIIHPSENGYPINTANSSQPINIVPDLANPSDGKLKNPLRFLNDNTNKDIFSSNTVTQQNKPKITPYYTIPANATGVHDRLMTALVGRIPIKGVVTDPYPFKLVFSDDTLAANGLRVPHLLKMIVSGFTEGDLNMLSVRGWVTSLTFVFDDGTISNTTSNDNDIGHFSKENALGYLSDKLGNPFIRGHLITNAPEFLAGNTLLYAGQGFANAYSAAQTTSTTNILGGSTTTVTGSPYHYAEGQGLANAANGIQQWWKDREENSFDAIYVATVDEQGKAVEISVNFTKEIDIDYNPQGRRIAYAQKNNDPDVSRNLD